MATKTKTKAVQDFLELLKHPDVRDALDLPPIFEQAFPMMDALSPDAPTVNQVEAPDGVWVDVQPTYQSRTYGQAFGAVRVDGAGNIFTASRFIWGNYSYGYVRKYAPNGTLLGKWNVGFAGLPHTPNPGVAGVGKIDGIAICPSGSDLIVLLTNHVLDAQRQNQLGWARIPGVYVPHTGANPESGASPTFIPTGSDPDPGGDVDYDLIREIVKGEIKFEVQRIVGADANSSLVNRFSHGDDVRGQIRKVAKQALVYLADPANYNDPADPEHLAQKYQDAQFGMTLNAIWVDLVKMVTGSEEATGYDAARLNAALRALIRNPQESEEPTS